MKKLLIGAGLLALATGTASAATFTFTTSGQNLGLNVTGAATIITTVNSMSIELANTTPSPAGIAQVLDGFRFEFAVPGVTGLSMTGALTPNGGIDCSGVAHGNNIGACTPVAAGSLPPNDDWLLAAVGAPTGFQISPTGLHPYGIINNTLLTDDGIPNGEHNPYLLGPVTFNFGFDALTYEPRIIATSFIWGTNAGTTPGEGGGGSDGGGQEGGGDGGGQEGGGDGGGGTEGGTQTPEPAMLALFGLALAGGASRLRKRLF